MSLDYTGPAHLRASGNHDIDFNTRYPLIYHIGTPWLDQPPTVETFSITFRNPDDPTMDVKFSILLPR
jgi:hypothetical protein